jgi:HEAT repeat protein
MRSAIRSSVLVLILAALHAPLRGDSIYLRSGYRLDGKVAEDRSTKERVVLDVDSVGSVTIDRSQVLAVEKNDRLAIRPEKPAPEGQLARAAFPGLVAVHLKKGHGYYGSGPIYGIPSGESNDVVLVLTIPGLGEIKVPKAAVDRLEPVEPLGASAGPAPAALGPRSIRTTHMVKLKNGSRIPGTLVQSPQNEPLKLDVGSIGRLYIPRDQVADLQDFTSVIQLPPETEPEKAESTAPPAAQPGAPPAAQPGVTPPPPAAAGGAPEAAPISPSLRSEIEEELYELTRWRTRNRVRAENNLVRIGPAAIPFLARVIHDPFELTRRAVARIVRDIGDPSGIPLLIDALLDEDGYVREISADALRRMTRRDFGYTPYAPLPRRLEAQRQWREWSDVEGRR